MECKRAVKWICDYICYQCSRPPPSHSKDLHSTIVAAFQCLAVWLIQHPYLLQDKDSLTIILEVVELGISGSKSIGKPGEPVKLKDEKELKPVSMRVRDAAETLLTIILEQVGYFPSQCGIQSTSSLLDEVTLIKHVQNTGGNLTPEQATQKFRYFVTENSTVLAILEEPLGNDQDPQPTVTLLMRSPHGRATWTAQLRHLPRSKSGTKYHAVNPGRPIPMNDMHLKRNDVEQKHFPDIVDRVPPCIADYSIPTLDSIIQKVGSDTTKQLSRLLDEQLVFEKLSWAETECSPDGLGHAQESMPPNVCHEFQAARLFLAHFGFLTIGENSPQKTKEMLSPSLIVLDTKSSGFVNDLAVLDKMSPRTCDTVHIFYVRAGQSSADEIIENMNEENVASLDANFWSMLTSLGKSVDIDEHSGWTGFINTSWRINSNRKSSRGDFKTGEMCYNGEKRIIYWADVASEIAFVVPNRWNRCEFDSSDGSCLSSTQSHSSDVCFERSVSEQGGKERNSLTHKTLSLDLEKNVKESEPVPPARSGRRTGANKPIINWTPSAKILLVWLESYEDYLAFPTDDLLVYTRIGEEMNTGSSHRACDTHIVFLHALNSGLLRVKLLAPPGRMNFATPLVDGMVVSKRVIGGLVRETAYNMAKRKRLESDSYQPPHVRRRLKVQEMIQKYKLDLTEPELLTHLFMTNNNN